MNDDWKRLISGSFGCEDIKFAMHPSDQSRAVEMLCAALASGIDFKDYLESIESWMREALSRKHFPKQLLEEHVKEQIRRVKEVGSYFSVNSSERL